jgi:hypothetical protein
MVKDGRKDCCTFGVMDSGERIALLPNWGEGDGALACVYAAFLTPRQRIVSGLIPTESA